MITYAFPEAVKPRGIIRDEIPPIRYDSLLLEGSRVASLNRPAVGSDCGGLWLDYAYCTQGISPSLATAATPVLT